MTALVAAELLKLRTARTTRLTVLGALAFAGVLGAANAGLAGVEGNPELGSSSWVVNVLGVSTIPAAAALLLGVLLAAGEYQHRTITTTFLVAPRRPRVVAAKVAAAALTGTGLAVAMAAVAVLVTVPFVLADGATVDAVHAGAGRTVSGLLLASVLLGALGVLIGMLVRSQVAAVVVVAAWALVLEGVVDVVSGGNLRRWLPGGAAADLVGGDGGTMLVAGCVLAGWVAAAALATVAAVQRRDVG